MVSRKQPIERSATELLKVKFSDAVSLILDPSNHEGAALLNYLQGVGKRLKISEFDTREILVEAATRGLYKIDRTGIEIYNPRAWLSKTCTFILLDMMKDEKKIGCSKKRIPTAQQRLML